MGMLIISFKPSFWVLIDSFPLKKFIHNINKPTKNREMDDFRIQTVLGQGSFGKVYRATHVDTKCPVAIKTLNKKKIVEEGLKERIEAQISVLKALKHENIAELYQVIQESETICLVMECVEGYDLLEYLKKVRNVQEKSCVRILKQILEALKYAHSQKICHRDIKLANILIDDKQKVKIIDFGLSAKYEPGKKLKTYCGSPCFAAPQLISQLPYNPAKVDVWSTGVVFYSLLTQTLPFYHYDVKKLYKIVQKGKYQIPSTFSKLAIDFFSNIFKVNPLHRFSLQEALNHRLITQYQSDKKDMFQKMEEQAKFHNLQVEKTKIIYKILKFNINFTNKEIQQCLFQNVRKFNSLNTFVCCLSKYSLEKLKSIYQDLAGPSRTKGFLIGKPSLTINTEEEQLVSSRQQKHRENSKILSPKTNISSQDVPLRRSKLLRRSQSSKQAKNIKMFSERKKAKEICVSFDEKDQRTLNLKSVRLEYFGAELHESVISSPKLISPKKIMPLPSLSPISSLQLSKEINLLDSVKQSDFRIERYIRVNLSKDFQKSHPEKVMKKKYNNEVRKRSQLGLESLRLSGSITNTMLMSLEQNTTRKKQNGSQNIEDVEKPKNKYLGPFNITHSILGSYRDILRILRQAGMDNPQISSQNSQNFSITEKTISNANYGDFDSQQIRTRQFVVIYPLSRNNENLVTSSFTNMNMNEKDSCSYQLKILRLQGFTNRYLIRVQPFCKQLVNGVVAYIYKNLSSNGQSTKKNI